MANIYMKDYDDFVQVNKIVGDWKKKEACNLEKEFTKFPKQFAMLLKDDNAPDTARIIEWGINRNGIHCLIYQPDLRSRVLNIIGAETYSEKELMLMRENGIKYPHRYIITAIIKDNIGMYIKKKFYNREDAYVFMKEHKGRVSGFV